MLYAPANVLNDLGRKFPHPSRKRGDQLPFGLIEMSDVNYSSGFDCGAVESLYLSFRQLHGPLDLCDKVPRHGLSAGLNRADEGDRIAKATCEV
jgi:hypothetical protein